MYTYLFCFICTTGLFSHQSDTLTLFFVGDLMGHMPVHDASREKNGYNYDSIYQWVQNDLSSSDYTIGNLETTISSSKISGYPRFAAPREYLVSAKNAGINVLMTANNHSLDYKESGLFQTLFYLDSLGIKHTGTYYDALHRDTANLLVLQKGAIRIGILNYTFSTNQIKIDNDTLVNRMYLGWMYKDILEARLSGIDGLILVLHWGMENELFPRRYQRELAKLFKSWGVDMLVGIHPHVIQPFDKDKDGFVVAYSLGNFISNQRKVPNSGGAILKTRWVKSSQNMVLDQVGYELVWVDKYRVKNRLVFRIIKSDDDTYQQKLPEPRKKRMKAFRMSTMAHLDSTSVGITTWR